MDKDTTLGKEKAEISFRLFQLGFNVQNGQNGYRGDIEEAKKLYESASILGHTAATYNLGVLLNNKSCASQEDILRAKQLYEKAAARGYAPAMNNLGMMLEDGDGGIKKDPVRAKKLYERAIELGGSDLALCSLADLLRKGAPGVPVYLARARDLYELAVSKGVHFAMYELGVMYEQGNSVIEKDLGEAIQLYKQAVELGNEDARNRLAEIAPKTLRSIPGAGPSNRQSGSSVVGNEENALLSESLREDLKLIDKFIQHNTN